MGYASYNRDGMDRGYAVKDVCNHKGCFHEVDRGLGYLCYGCTLYFCGLHLGYGEKEMSCFAGDSTQTCFECD